MNKLAHTTWNCKYLILIGNHPPTTLPGWGARFGQEGVELTGTPVDFNLPSPPVRWIVMCLNKSALHQSTKSKNHQKLVLRHIWQDALDEPNIYDTDINKQIYAKRKETIEHVFADLKQKHGLRWTNQKGLEKIQCKRCLFLLP